jgi:hypothetical protein
MSPDRTCAAPGCGRTVSRRPGRGRPPIYCSPACRPSQTGGRGQRRAVTVEVDPDDSNAADPAAARTFLVRLRRGKRAVVVAREVGRFSAAVLAEELRGLLGPVARQGGGTTE